MKTALLVLSLLLVSADGIAIDDFHCKIPTCRDFYYVSERLSIVRSRTSYVAAEQGLRDRPRRLQYEKVCLDTVFELQAIPRKHGLCINRETGKLNPPCICKCRTCA